MKLELNKKLFPLQEKKLAKQANKALLEAIRTKASQYSKWTSIMKEIVPSYIGLSPLELHASYKKRVRKIKKTWAVSTGALYSFKCCVEEDRMFIGISALIHFDNACLVWLLHRILL